MEMGWLGSTSLALGARLSFSFLKLGIAVVPGIGVTLQPLKQYPMGRTSCTSNACGLQQLSNTSEDDFGPPYAGDPGLTPFRYGGPGGVGRTNNCCGQGNWTGKALDPFPPGTPSNLPGGHPYTPPNGPKTMSGLPTPTTGSRCFETLKYDMIRAWSRALTLRSHCMEPGSPLFNCLGSIFLSAGNGWITVDQSKVKLECVDNCASKRFAKTDCTSTPIDGTVKVQICLNTTEPSSLFGWGASKPPRDGMIVHELMHACFCRAKSKYGQFDHKIYGPIQECMTWRCYEQCAYWMNWGWDVEAWGAEQHGAACQRLQMDCPLLQITCGSARCRAPYPFP